MILLYMPISGEDNNDEVKITFENIDSNTEDNDDAQDNSEIYPTEPLRVIREQIVNVIPNPLPEEEEDEEDEEDDEEDEEERQKVLASMSRQLKKQTILMQKMDEDIEALNSRINSMTDQLQAIGFIKSKIESLPSRIDRKLNEKGKLVNKTKNIDKKKSTSHINKVRKIHRKNKRKN
jgi:predicted RNase H-like nuclease (RuvC/YqgF family)